MSDIQKKTYIDKDETDSMEKKQTNEKTRLRNSLPTELHHPTNSLGQFRLALKTQ